MLANLAAAGTIAAKSPLVRAGFIKQPCGWRRVTGIGLRSVGSKFALATFGVDAADLRGRVTQFIAGNSDCNLRVIERDGCCVGVPARDRCCFTFRVEPLDDAARRFSPPELCCDEHASDALLNFVCRVMPDGQTADVWMQVHHAAADGARMQELLGELERALGQREAVVFPTPETWRPHAISRAWHRPGDRPIEHALDFLDFTPLLEG